jgi:hypothetical protein
MTPGGRVAQLYPQALGTHFNRLLRHAWVTVGLFFNPGHHTGGNRIIIYIFKIFAVERRLCSHSAGLHRMCFVWFVFVTSEGAVCTSRLWRVVSRSIKTSVAMDTVQEVSLCVCVCVCMCVCCGCSCPALSSVDEIVVMSCTSKFSFKCPVTLSTLLKRVENPSCHLAISTFLFVQSYFLVNRVAQSV